MSEVALQFAIICDGFSMDTSGKYSFYGLFDEILAKQFPAKHDTFYIVSRWIDVSETPTGKNYRQSIKIKHIASGKLIFDSTPFEKSFTFITGRHATHTIVGQLSQVIFQDPGEYVVELYLDGAIQKQEIYFRVEQHSTVKTSSAPPVPAKVESASS